MSAEIRGADGEAIRRAAALLARGEVVAFPTETLYGLAALALDPAAVERLSVLKGRPSHVPFPVIVADRAMVDEVVAVVPPIAERLMQAHWPGPLTLVCRARTGLPPGIVGPTGGVGVRVSSDPVASALVRCVGAPITATSANLSGQPPATTAALARLPGASLVLDGGMRNERASTVVDVTGSRPVVVRAGVIEVEID